jgi:tetratricopeptide (TPR) repeat protein
VNVGAHPDPGERDGADVVDAGAVIEAAEALVVKARSFGDAGRPARALALCRRALGRLDRLAPGAAGVGECRCRILITAAYQHSGLGDVEAALIALTDADGADPAQAAAVGGTRAMVLMRAGQHSAALRAFDDAIPGLRRGDPRLLSPALLNRGWLHMTMGRLGGAQLDTQGALDAAESGNDSWGVFMAAHNLGYIQFLAGDLPGALVSMEAALRAVADPPVGTPAMDRARVLLAAGLTREASESGQLAIEDFDRNKAISELPDALVVTAETDLLRGDWQSALARARRAKVLNRRRGNENAALLAELVELKAAANRRGLARNPLVQARSDAARAAVLAAALAERDLPGDAVSAQLVTAQALLEADDIAGAQTAVAPAIKLGRAIPMGTRLYARLVSARIDMRLDQPRQGFAHIRQGLDDLADFQSRFGSQDMQSGAAVHGAALARLGLRTAVLGGSPAAILQWLERSRAVTTRLPVVHPPADHELAETLGLLRLATIDARAAAVAGSRDAALDRRVADLRRHVRTRSWTVSGSGSVQRPLSLAAVQRLLAGDPSAPTVIALLHGDVQVHALVITAHRAIHRRLADWPAVNSRIRRTAADLDLLAAPRIPRPVRQVAGRSLADDLARLDDDLLGPIAKDLADGPAIIAAVGPMATLPWGLLPSFVGRPVSVSSSVTAAMTSVGRPGRAHLRGVLVVAGPGVPGGADEAATVAGMHPGAHLLVDAAATGEAVLSQMPQGGLLHIAAHGHHEPDSPLFSSVQLVDGPLYGYDIAPNPALPDHVVLSSCDVGRSDDRPGGEPLGLAAALLRSGVSTVVAGISRISDEVAAATMIVYHERLLAGDGPAVALAVAIRAAGNGTEDPPAPLTCFGAGS